MQKKIEGGAECSVKEVGKGAEKAAGRGEIEGKIGVLRMAQQNEGTQKRQSRDLRGEGRWRFAEARESRSPLLGLE